MFRSGGGAELGRHSGAYEKFWGIRALQPQVWSEGWGRELMDLVGVQINEDSLTNLEGRWVETINPELLKPSNLHRTQLTRRLKNIK